MMRLIAVTVLELVANAIGLLIAAWLLPDFQISAMGFVVVVALFTAAKFILGPLLFKLSFKYVRALNGGVALVTTLAGLWVTTWLTNGLVITGFSTWVLATLIVWLCGVLAILVLPLFLFKQALSRTGAPSRPTLPPGLG